MDAVRATIASLAALALVACQMPNASWASSEPQQLFITTLESLQGLDPSVASVKVRVLAAPRNKTGCGNAGNDDSVAFYCLLDRTIYVSVNTLTLIARSFGPYAIRYLAAHELAHGRQHAVTGFAKDLVWSSVLDELQADCIAGSYLRMAYGYSPESPQGEGVRRFAFNIGDREFLHHDWHGNPRLRVAAVSLGMRTAEPSSCLSSKRFNYEGLRGSGAELIRQWRNP